MYQPAWQRICLWGCVATLAGVAGCEGLGGHKRPPPEPAPVVAPPVDPLLTGTIGAISYLGNIGGQPVRGFGIVVGLGEDGSSDCPTFVREHLIQTMARERDTWANLEERRRFSPAELIDSPSTAAVEVIGLVPPGATAGTRFDILVRAIPGTATRSLTNGLLLPCEMRLYSAAGSDEEQLARQVVARACGPVFVNPFTPADTRRGALPLPEGFVLSGGQSAQTRSLRLLLREPSYALARRVENRINERFGQRPPIADARSRGYVVVEMPPAYARRRADFITLLPHLYLDNQPAFVEAKLGELARRIVQSEADGEHISLAWEGIGRSALPQIQPLYAHAQERVRFYAARAGLRLNDVTALPVLADIAHSANHALALPAIRELGLSTYPQAALRLMPLLDRAERVIRVAAYEALRTSPQPIIQTATFPHVLDRHQVNVVLELIDSQGPPLIYARCTATPRIALFGTQIPVDVPLFYADEQELVTMNAHTADDDIALLTRRQGKLWEPLVVPPRVAALIAALADRPIPDESGRPRGLGLTYSQVMRILAALCADGTIPAPLEVEAFSAEDVLGPPPRPERPEADELDEPVGQLHFDDEPADADLHREQP